MVSSHVQVVGGRARFQRLAAGVVRMEYSPSGTFEDRRSIRGAERPAAEPFEGVTTEGGETILDFGGVEVSYRPDGRPFHAGNLTVRRPDGGVIWNPATVDAENLGGVHVSLDLQRPGFLPRGVHPATMAHHRNTGDLTFYTATERAKAANPRFQPLHVDEYMTAGVEPPPEAERLLAERAKFPPGLLSRAGFFLYNDTDTPLLDPETEWVVERAPEEGYLDLTFFWYGRDFKRAFAQFRTVFGAAALLPRYALGLWYSRFPTFNEAESRELVAEFDRHGLPLDMLVMDLEWHQHGWHGWTWDRGHFPDPDGFLRFLRENDVHTTFNVHPDLIPAAEERLPEFLRAAGLPCGEADLTESPGMDAGVAKFGGYDLADRRHAEAFLDTLHRPVQDQGVDFWWIDGAAPVKRIRNLDAQFWTNHVYWRHVRENYADRRPMIFSRTAGFGAHRYPFHFTGDTWAYWEVLENLVEQTIRAGHLGQSYITHDIGGHLSPFLMLDPELYVRWVQFAVLNPIVRLHSGKQGPKIAGERRPWLYGPQVLHIFQTAMRMRMELVPYLYTMARESVTKCLPLVRSNPIERPDWEAGYGIWDSYFLGDRIYAAPMVRPGRVRPVVLPPGRWYRVEAARAVTSDGVTPMSVLVTHENVPLHYYRAGSLMVKQPNARRASFLPSRLVVEIFTGGDGSEDAFELYEDDGKTQACDAGEFRTQVFRMRETAQAVELEILPAQGRFEGAPTRRDIEVRVIGRRVHEARDESGAIPFSSDGCVLPDRETAADTRVILGLGEAF